MARALDVFLQVDVADAEGGLGFALRRLQRLAHLAGRPDDAHPAPAAAGHCLDDDGIPEILGNLDGALFAVDRAVAARQYGDAGLLHGAARARLVAEQADDVRRRPDELDVTRVAHFGEVRALGQEPVTRMDRVGAGDLRRADDGGNAQIALGAPGRPDADVFIGESDVQRILVGLRVDGHRANAELAARADHPQRNLPTVRDQNLFEHECLSESGNRYAERVGTRNPSDPASPHAGYR